MIRTLALLVITAVAFTYCFQAGFVSLLTWVWLSIMMPQSEAWGSFLLSYSNMAAGILTVIAVFTAKDRKLPPFNNFTVLLFLFTALIILSQVFSLNRALSSRQFSIGTETLFITFAVLLLANSKVKIHTMVWIIVLSVGYYGVTRGLITIATGGGGIVTGPSKSVLSDNNQLAVGLASTAPLAFYLYRISADKWTRMFALGIFVLSIIGAIGTHSRGGLISLGVLALGLIARSRKRVLNMIILVIVVGGTLLIMPAKWFDRMNTISTAEEDGSFMGRVAAWEVAYKLALEHPFLGIGARLQYKAQYNHHVQPDGVIAREIATHNSYFEIMAGNGFVALGAFLGMMATTFIWAGKTMKLTQNKPGFTWANELVSMLQVSLLVFGVGTFALSMEYWTGFWINMVLIVNLREIVLRELKMVPVASRQETYA
jgi:probable O-glycosylation ligase (exosortase A-associated)